MVADKEKIKVGVVCDQFGNLQRGGAEIQVENTVKYLRQTGKVDIDFITYETTSINQYDIIHFFKSIFEFTPVALAAKRAGIPYVVSTIIFPKNYFFEKYTYKFCRHLTGQLKSIVSPARRVMLWDNAEYLFPNTDMEAAFLQQVTTAPHIEIVPNGLDLKEFEEVGPEPFFSTFPDLQGKKFVLNVARIEKRKNQKNLVLACQALQIPLVVIGKIWDTDYFQEIQAIGYKDFYYLGPIYDRRLLFSAYVASTLFCLPSTLETPGIAAMEAAYYNIPVVVPKYGGTQYYFGDQAYYVDWKDVKDIQRSITTMLEKKSVNTRALISEFSWDKIADKYIGFYNQILNRIS